MLNHRANRQERKQQFVQGILIPAPTFGPINGQNKSINVIRCGSQGPPLHGRSTEYYRVFVPPNARISRERCKFSLCLRCDLNKTYVGALCLQILSIRGLFHSSIITLKILDHKVFAHFVLAQDLAMIKRGV